MGDKRLVGPTCLTMTCTPGIDQGTSARTWSPVPGPVGAAINGLVSLTADAGKLAIDQLLLAAELRDQGYGLLFDVYGPKSLGGGKPVAEAWDTRINNMGRARNAYSREHVVEATPAFGLLAQWFAGNDPMKAKLLQHYRSKQGANRTMTLAELKSMRTYFDLFETDNYSTNLRPAIVRAMQGETAAVDTEVRAQNDALGNFPIHLRGTLRIAAGTPTGGKDADAYFGKLFPVQTDPVLLFEGTMVWSDKWDFDSKMAEFVAARAEGKSAGRDVKANLQVAAVAALVDGVPFEAASEAVKVTQYSGQWPVY